MAIVKEHYRDFVGALSVKCEEIKKEIKSLYEEENAFFERDILEVQLNKLTETHKYFSNESRWSFESMWDLKEYIDAMEIAFKALNEYSKFTLPVDGGELVGITQDEWNENENYRHELGKKIFAWNLFRDFCKYGDIK